MGRGWPVMHGMKDERDPWSVIQAIMHPASGAPAILCTLAAVGGELNLTGGGCRVGLVSIDIAPAANDSGYPLDVA